MENPMTTDDRLELPSYLHHAPDVASRVTELAARPVVLSVEGLCREFNNGKGNVVALSDVGFEVRRREFISVIGPSGCGKSTLIRILAGLDQPSSGRVMLDGKPVDGPG